jgi:ribosomal protein S1
MASASSTSAKNLFGDSKRRLSERVQVNVNNLGSVTRQVQRGSKTHEMLTQTAKNFSQAESTMENSFNNLQKMQVLLAQLNQQEQSIRNSVKQLPDVREQVRDMQR